MVPRLPHLETFAEAAELGSFTAAARRLGIQAETVSQRVQQLEAWLNTTLFHRAAGGVTLTATGCRLEAYARRIFKLPAEAWAAVTAEPDAVTGSCPPVRSPASTFSHPPSGVLRAVALVVQAIHYFNGGFTYRVTPNFQLDIRAGLGLSRAADDFFTGTGFAVRY